MATIFTRAKAAKKIIDLMELECGIKRKKMRCGSRLESDLGIVGDDTYELLQALQDELGVDMTEFDCDDLITPEGMPAGQMIVVVGISLAMVAGGIAAFTDAPPMLLSIGSLIMIFGITWIVEKIASKPKPELSVRDLVLSVEAGHWVTPKSRTSRG